MRFGVNSLLFTNTFDRSDLGLLDHVRDLGFDTLEVTPVDPDVFPAADLRRRAEDLGMHLNANFALPLEANTIDPDPAVREKGVELSKKVVDLCIEAGVEVYCGANYCAWLYFTGHKRTEDEWKWGVEAFRRIGEHAEGSSLVLAVETLNRFESYYLNTAADAVRFVEDVGLDNCKVHLDSFHLIREEDDMAAAIRATGDQLACFQACGSQRGIPGKDMVPWDETLQALADIGYDFCITVESFNPNFEVLASKVAIWREFADSPEQLAQEGLKFLQGKCAEIFPAREMAGVT